MINKKMLNKIRYVNNGQNTSSTFVFNLLTVLINFKLMKFRSKLNIVFSFVMTLVYGLEKLVSCPVISRVAPYQ